MIRRERRSQWRHGIEDAVLMKRDHIEIPFHHIGTPLRAEGRAFEKTNTAALSDMRRLLAVLRDTEDDPQQASRDSQPSLARLDSLVDQVRSSGLPVELSVTGEPTAVPPGVDLSAYRIVQEALTNALKHAGEATARVFLRYGPDDLTVTVRDNGDGTAFDSGTGQGLIGIRERVAVVGGEVNAGPLESGGFEVTARLPYSLEVS
jgi:signal transduction histidine kinase